MKKHPKGTMSQGAVKSFFAARRCVPPKDDGDISERIDAFITKALKGDSVWVPREDYERWKARDQEDAEDERRWKEIDAKTPEQLNAELAAEGVDIKKSRQRIAASLLKGTDAVVVTKEEIASLLVYLKKTQQPRHIVSELRKRVNL